MDNVKKRIIFQGAVSQFELDPFGIHGVNHWHNVYFNCQNIWRMIHSEYEIPHDDDWLFWNFAMLHDCCRLYDTTDPGHGARAAKLIPDDDSEFNKVLRHAILGHTNGKVSTNLGVGICWDADRLDLPRVGIVPDPKLMSTTGGQELARAIAAPPAGFDPQSDDPRRTRKKYDQEKAVRTCDGIDSPDPSGDGVR